MSERPLWKRVIRVAVLTALIGFAAVVLLLFFLQGKLIYHPRRYAEDFRARLQVPVEELDFTTEQGKQAAFYLPSLAGGVPRRLWITFSGNGGDALGWLDVVQAFRHPGIGAFRHSGVQAETHGDDLVRGTAFLLVDYPGYGICEGSPGPNQIDENGEAAFKLAAEKTGLESDSLATRTGILGHSLGCAAGLRFACRHSVDRIILLSPFTSLQDMAGRAVGAPLKYLLRGNFDNRACMKILSKRKPPPKVSIFHGSDDTLIPPAMGRELAESYPGFAAFNLVNGGTHESILDDSLEKVLALMRANPTGGGRGHE